MTEEKINDLIFKELLKRGYSQRGKTRVWNIADSKLWYLTPEQAQAYLDVLDSKDYKERVVEKENRLIQKHLPDIMKLLSSKPLNIIDLGCGDGKKVQLMIKPLKEKIARIRYCPIDISGYMVQKAIENMSNLEIEEVIESQYNISDFENLENITPLLRHSEFKQNLFTLFGFTFGNFEINELLYEIRSSMKKGDILLITDGIGEERKKFRAASGKKDKNTQEFMDLIPLQLGLAREDFEFNIRYVNSRLEYYHILTKDKTIEFQNREVNFKKGDEIISAVSYSHEKDELLTILNMYFDRVELKISEDESMFLAICFK